MFALSTFLTSTLVAVGFLAGVAVFDTQTLFLRYFAVPPAMVQVGYTPAVLESQIAETLKRLERAARTRPESWRLALETDESSMEVIAGFFNLTPVVRVMQSSSGLVEFTVSGNIVEDGGENVLRMHIAHRGGTVATKTIRKPKSEIEALIEETARHIMQIIDPQILCAAMLRRHLEGGVGSVDEVIDCTHRGMRVAQIHDQAWLYNLAGVAHFLKRDHAAAAADFRSALQADPGFSPALVNVGVLLATAERHGEAIKAFAAVFRGATIGESPQTRAAAYMEWGNSLIALGRGAEAPAKLAAAVRADPLFAPAYFRWAELLPPGAQADELRRFGKLAEARHVQIYTENLVGVVRQGRAAPALR